jgi:hypothetical protein
MCEAKAAADDVAVAAHHHRLIHVGDGAHRVEVAVDDALPLARGALLHLADVGAGAERAAGAGQHNRPHLAVVRGRAQGLDQRLQHLEVDGVETVGTVQGNGGDSVGGLCGDGGALAHRVLSFTRRRG